MEQADTERLLRHFVEEDAVLRAYVYAATRSYADADDVLQDVWRTLIVKLDQYDDRRPFRAWALGVARMQVRKWRQEKGRNRELPSSEVLDLLAATAEEHADELDVRLSYLQYCLERLTQSSRAIMEMKYLQELKIAKIATLMRRNVAAIEMTLVRARRALRECIDNRMQEEQDLKMEAGE
ncbi:MAG: sigma-70 family RNA polymerase sigma factor [Magnetococcus sp. WYHC-3]